MRIDPYTRMMLTIIAACLVWLSFGGPSLVTRVHAQTQAHVLIAGWIDDNGKTHAGVLRQRRRVAGLGG